MELQSRKHRLMEVNISLSSELPGRQGNSRTRQNAQSSMLTMKMNTTGREASIYDFIFQFSALGGIYHMSFQIRDIEQHNGQCFCLQFYKQCKCDSYGCFLYQLWLKAKGINKVRFQFSTNFSWESWNDITQTRSFLGI